MSCSIRSAPSCARTLFSRLGSPAIRLGWLTLPIAKTCATSSIAAAAGRPRAAQESICRHTRASSMSSRAIASCGWSGVGTVGGATVRCVDQRAPGAQGGGPRTRPQLRPAALALERLRPDAARADLHHLRLRRCRRHDGHQHGRATSTPSRRSAWAGSIAARSRRSSPSQPAARTLSAPMKRPRPTPRRSRCLKGTDPATGAKTWYYIEYRQPIGFDAALAGLYQIQPRQRHC